MPEEVEEVECPDCDGEGYADCTGGCDECGTSCYETVECERCGGEGTLTKS